MSEEEGNKAWAVPLGLLIFCTVAVVLASAITLSTVKIPTSPYGQAPSAVAPSNP